MPPTPILEEVQEMDIAVEPEDQSAYELARMRHSAAHLMAEAVHELYPDAKFAIGPAIEDGFYYDIDLSHPLTPDDLGGIEAVMAKHRAADEPFVRQVVGREQALAIFRDNPYKVELIEGFPPGEEITTYQQGTFLDLCRGPHVASTGKIGPFKLLSVAGAYWRGDEHRPMLQRIYGTVWRTDQELADFLWRREEAKKRDHRRLGVQLDLFSFHDVSPAMAFWHPKGQLLWRTLEASMRELQARRGYQEVSTPIVVSERLWKQSGHWDLYRENMFLIQGDEEWFSLKPMNCPESTFI